MDIRKIKKLIELINETGIGEIEVTSGEESVRISRFSQTGSAPAPQQIVAAPAIPAAAAPVAPVTQPDSLIAKPEAAPRGFKVNSPMVGTVYLAATPGDPPFVKVGQQVNVGDTLCLIEAMKMFNKIQAEKSGILSARLTENLQAVEFDQPLFIIDDGE